MDIKKLLFVTKFEKLHFDALQSLLSLKKAALNHVVFLNVIEREKVAMHRGTGYQKTEELKLREKANIRFIDWAEELYEQGLEVGVYIVVGSLPKQVITASEKETTDLIVLGHHDKGAFEKLYSASAITEIIRRSATPVLVYRYTADDRTATANPFAKPLFATDWSVSNDRAVEIIKGLKGVIKEIDIIHVAQEKELDRSSVMEVQKLRKECRKKLNKICKTLEAVGIRTDPHVYIGEAVEQIETAARECQSSMIIVGSSSKSSWKEKWIGSIPKKLAEESLFPVLLVPPEKK